MSVVTKSYPFTKDSFVECLPRLLSGFSPSKTSCLDTSFSLTTSTPEIHTSKSLFPFGPTSHL